MLNYKEHQVTKIERELISVTCDVCKKEYTDQMEIQEFFQFNMRGGYNSIFGDGATIQLDMCQHCAKAKLGEYIRASGSWMDGYIREEYRGRDNG